MSDETLGHNNKEGYLSKKNRKGYYNSRYFQTANERISYWVDRASFERREVPTSSFEIKDIKTIELSSNNKTLSLIFGDKFRIDLRSEADDSRTWFELLTAKKSFYSVKELLVDFKNERMQFRTKTFSSLLVIPVQEQNEWIMDHLNDTFDAAANHAQISMLRSNPLWIMKASRAIVEEFIMTCDECSLEMELRNPKVTAHCRGYMHRYAEMMKGHLSLELSVFMAAGNKQITEMGESALCIAITLMSRLDILRTYSFLPHELVSNMIACLLSVGELMSALLNLSIQRIEAWFYNTLALPPSGRGGRLVEINKVLADALTMIHFQAPEEFELYRDILIKVAMSMQLNFSDQLLLMDFDEYDEVALLSHINACHTIADQLPSHYRINGDREEMVRGRISCKEGVMEEKSKEFSESRSKRNCDNDCSEFSDAVAGRASDSASVCTSIELNLAATDSVRCACLSSARMAVVHAVQLAGRSVSGILSMFFKEKKGSAWIGGDVCNAYLDRLSGWLRDLLESLPQQYVDLAKIEAARAAARMYLKAFIRSYQENKRSQFSGSGLEQVIEDMRTISVSLMELFNNVSDAVEEQQLLLFLGSFISCPQADLLQMYALSLQTFGTQYALEIYDLMRLMVKVRTDCSAKTRKGMLALCAEFNLQLQCVVAADGRALGGASKKRPVFLSVFSDLCPKVGVEHCTGKKWSIERMADPVAVRTLVAHFVTETYQAARKRERARALKEEEECKGVVEAAPVHILKASQTSISRRQRSDSGDPSLPLNAATATAGRINAEVQIRRMESSRTETLHPRSELRSLSTCKEAQSSCIRTEEVKEEVVLHDSIEMCTAAKITCSGDELRGSKLERDRKELGILKKDINPFGDRDSDSDE